MKRLLLFALLLVFGLTLLIAQTTPLTLQNLKQTAVRMGYEASDSMGSSRGSGIPVPVAGATIFVVKRNESNACVSTLEFANAADAQKYADHINGTFIQFPAIYGKYRAFAHEKFFFQIEDINSDEGKDVLKVLLPDSQWEKFGASLSVSASSSSSLPGLPDKPIIEQLMQYIGKAPPSDFTTRNKVVFQKFIIENSDPGFYISLDTWKNLGHAVIFTWSSKDRASLDRICGELISLVDREKLEAVTAPAGVVQRWRTGDRAIEVKNDGKSNSDGWMWCSIGLTGPQRW